MFAVILNPASGAAGRPHARTDIEELFHKAGADVRVYEVPDPHEIPAAAREALGAHPEALVAGGGDGTVSAVAAALAGTGTPLGVLPLGTLNHFAKDAGIPVELEKAIQAIVGRRARPVDIGRVNDRLFVNNASIGVYPSFVESRDRLRAEGRPKWWAGVVAVTEVLRREDEVAIRLESDRRVIVARTPFVFVGNNEYLVEGLRIGARPRLDAGRLHAYYAPPLHTRDLPRLFARALFGMAHRAHALESMSGSELWVEPLFASHVDVACDGEVVTLDAPLRFRSWHGALDVLVPAAG